MKRILNISAAIAAVLSFAACQQTQEVSENIVNVKVVTDGIIEPEDAVKTYMGENSSTGNPEVKWNADDAIALYEFVDDAAEPTQNPTSNGTRLTDDNHIAEFNVPLNADKAEGSTYTYVAIYPDGAVSKGGSGDKSFDRVQIPAVQNAQFIGDDYSTANFDPAADVLVGVPVVRDSRPTESDYLGFSFKRVGTIGKLTLKNLWAGEVVSSVEISLPDKSKLSGYSKIDIKGGEITEAGYSTGEKITVNVPHSDEAAMETAEDINNVICFRCLSGTWATGTDVTVKVTTDKAIYTKTTALPRDYEFVEGGLTAFSFNMSTATREEISTEDYSGSWMIVSENGGTLYAMPAYTSGKSNIPAVTYTLNGEGKATSADGLDDCQYTITKVSDGGTYDGCYTIQDANDLYLYAAGGSSSNHLKGDSELGEDAKYYWDITFAEGQYSIVAKSTGRNVMQYNSSSTLFSCYGSASQVAVSLFPWENVLPAGAPVIQVSSTTLALNADGTEKADPITVTGKNLPEDITATSSDESWLLAEVIDGVLDVVAEENTGSEDRSATITLSSTGASNVVIEVTQDKASSGPSGNVLTFNFVTHPNGWPVGSSAGTAGSYTYTLGGKAYTFIHSTKSGNGIYMGGTSGSSGYLMVCSGNNLGLPAIEGYRLAKVVGTLNGSGTPSTKSAVSVTDGSNVITGGAAQTWSTKGASYTYDLTDTEDNTVYYLSVSTANCQIITLELTYEVTVALTSVTVSGEPTKKTYKEGDEFETAGLIATAKYADNSEKVVTDDVEWTVTTSPLTAGTTSVSVKASYKDIESAAYVVNGLTVTESATLSSISVKTAPTKVVYNEGEKFDPAGLEITRNYSDSSSDDYAYSGHESEFTFDPTTSTDLTTSNTSVTITYGGKSVNQTITVNEVPALSTMDAIFSAATATETDAKIKFNNWVVSGVKGSNAYVTDGTKGLIIYTSSHGFVAGDILSGTVSCKLVKYNGSSELKGVTALTEGLTVTKGGTITPAEIAIAELSGVNTGAVITFESLQYDGTVFTDGENTIKPYNAITDLPTLTSGRNYSVTGVYVQYNTTKEIAPRTAADFVLLTTPYLIATADKTNVSAAGETVTITVDTNIEDWTVSSDNAAFTVGDKSGNTVPVTVSENTSTTDGRTAKITVSATGVSDVEITLTQAKKGSSTKTWKKVTDASSLAAGDKLLIVATVSGSKTAAYNGTFAADGSISSNIMSEVSVTISNNEIANINGAQEFTLGGESGSWTLSNGSKLLGATAAKKIAWGDGTTTWSISISNGSATIENKTSTYGKILYNRDSPRFTTYTSAPSATMALPMIFRYE